MEQTDKQQQDDLPISDNKLALKEVFLVADDNMSDMSALSIPQLYLEDRPGSYTVELFWDEARVTATELMYDQTVYALSDIDSLQILKLHRKRSVIQKKLSNFLAGIVITTGLVLLLSSSPWIVSVLGLTAILASVSYISYFNWWIEQRRRGEFGLLMTMKLDSKVVITSDSLKAIQALYQIMFRRLNDGNPTEMSLTVNMYTGETISSC